MEQNKKTRGRPRKYNTNKRNFTVRLTPQEIERIRLNYDSVQQFIQQSLDKMLGIKP